MDEIREEMIEECSKYGSIVHLNVDQNSPNGNVSLKFAHINGAVDAISGLNGKYYDGLLIILI